MGQQFHFFTYGKGVAPYGWYQKNYPGIHRFYWVQNGEGWYQAQDGKHSFQKGMFYLFPQNLPFEAGQNERNPIDHLYFDFCVVPPVKNGDVAKLPADEDLVCRNLAHTLQYLLEEEIRNTEMIETLFGQLLNRFCWGLKLERIADPRLEQVLRYIHSHYAENITNRQLAELIYLEENHFIRVFRDKMGVTPYQYLLRYRLNMASNLLMAGKSVAETAKSCGFSDSAALCHTMKRETGCSPSCWKLLSI